MAARARKGSKPRRGIKCKCGCGQPPAEGARSRKALCYDCGEIAYQSRTAFSRGLLTCHCGATLEPTCLFDGCAVQGEFGERAYSELMAREVDSAVRSDNAQRRGIRQMRCASCAYFRPFGANHDPTAEPDPCPRCGSTEPVTFGESRTVSEPDAIPF